MLEERIKAFSKVLEFRGLSKNTISSYRFRLEHFREFCEKEGISYKEVDGKVFRSFRNYLFNLNLRPRSVNAHLSSIKAFYDFLVEDGILKGNPFILTRLRVKEPKELPSFLTEGEDKILLSHLNKLPRHIAYAFYVMLFCGLRVSEVANFKPSDIIITENRVFLFVKKGKGKKDRLVPVMNRELAKALLELKEKAKGTLFKVKASTLKYYAYIIKKHTKIDFHTHRQRHNLATRLLSKGTPLDLVQEILGHKNIKTTRRYVKTIPERISKLAVKI